MAGNESLTDSVAGGVASMRMNDTGIASTVLQRRHSCSSDSVHHARAGQHATEVHRSPRRASIASERVREKAEDDLYKQQTAFFDRPADIYQPLNPLLKEIRLLTLEPAPMRHCLIHIRLETVSLYDGPEYEAISYAWGDPKDTTEVTVNGHPFPITVSLAGALRRFRYADRPRVLWADAVCINQESIDERSDQVAKMGDVYAGAALVLVWLGEPTNASESAAAKGIFEADWWSNRHLTYSERPIPRWADHWSWFMDLPWFRRLWVLQEARVARRVLVAYAGYTLYSRDLSDMYRILFGISKNSLSNAAQLHQKGFDTKKRLPWDMRVDLGSRSGLNHVWRYMNTSDPRDRVYAILYLLEMQIDIIVDYRKSQQQVMEDFVKAFSKKTGSLDLLDYSNVSDTSWPSWLLNLDRGDTRRVPFTQASSWVSHCASHASEDRPTMLKVGSLLHSRLQHVALSTEVLSGRINRFFDSSVSQTTFGAAFVLLICDRCLLIRTWKTALQQCPADFWQIVACGRWGSKAITHSQSVLADTIYNSVLSDGGLDLVNERVDVSSLIHRFGDSALLNFTSAVSDLDEWLPCVTTTGLAGKARRGARETDQVAILAGCDFPVILRPVPERGHDCYRVIGPAYIPSIMHGEAVVRAVSATASRAELEQVLQEFAVRQLHSRRLKERSLYERTSEVELLRRIFPAIYLV